MDWKDITLSQYNDIVKIKETYEGEELILQLVNYLYNVDGENLNYTDYLEKCNSLVFLTKEMPKVKTTKEYKINNRVYTFETNVTEMTTAQFFDYQNYTKSGTLQDILSVILIPKGKKYNTNYDMDVVKEDMLSLRIVDVQAISAFFLRTLEHFLTLMTLCSEVQIKTMKMGKEEEKNTLLRMEKTIQYCRTLLRMPKKQ